MSMRPGRRQDGNGRPGTKRPWRADRHGKPHGTPGSKGRGERPARPERVVPPPEGRPLDTMRIAKALARAGLCSRRDAERWIAEGRVAVNGEVLTSPARDVGPTDRVLVDGKPLPVAEPVRLWRYHKPRGLVTTHKDPEGRPTVFERLPVAMPRVVSVGRLDFNTEGLLLLTTDGALARHLELPATGWLRRYRVRVHGTITQARLDTLKEGLEVEGVRYGPIEARLDTVQGANAWLTVGIREGKNREVRRVLNTLGVEVNRLIRVSYGPFQLLDIEPGRVEEVKPAVIAEHLGRELADALGVVVPVEPEVVAPPPVALRAPRPVQGGEKRAKPWKGKSHTAERAPAKGPSKRPGPAKGGSPRPSGRPWKGPPGSRPKG